MHGKVEAGPIVCFAIAGMMLAALADAKILLAAGRLDLKESHSRQMTFQNMAC